MLRDQPDLVERGQQQAADVIAGLDVGDAGQGGQGEMFGVQRGLSSGQ